MTQRVVGGQTYNLGYDAENRMVSVSGAAAAAYTYTGDGQRIVASQNGTTTVYLGNYLEWAQNGETITTKSYYYAGTTRVAMRQDGGAPLWLFGDHLGSTNVAANYDGSAHGKLGYQAWGETRFVAGDIPTSFQYTGQRNEASIGLYYYGARWYDSSLGRFAQADTIVPVASQGVQAWDRYAAMNNNAINYIDPSGHQTCDKDGYCGDYSEIGYYVHRIPVESLVVEDELSWRAKRVYNLFLLYKNTPGWWNEDGNFTIEEFVGLWILHEASWGDPQIKHQDLIADLIAQAISQNLYVGGSDDKAPYCQSQSCGNGIFEYMAAASQEGDALFRVNEETISAYPGPSSEGPSNPDIMEAARRYGKAALHPSSLNLDANDAISRWGNYEYRTRWFRKQGLEDYTLYGPKKEVYYFFDDWYIYSANQAANW